MRMNASTWLVRFCAIVFYRVVLVVIACPHSARIQTWTKRYSYKNACCPNMPQVPLGRDPCLLIVLTLTLFTSSCNRAPDDRIPRLSIRHSWRDTWGGWASMLGHLFVRHDIWAMPLNDDRGLPNRVPVLFGLDLP